MTLRYDITPLKATLTADGYLVDQQAIIARTGIQLYQNADGTVRRELRMPEEVFHPDSLASFAGKPMTDDHPPEAVSAVNFKKYAIGVVTGAAYADGDHVRAPIILHDGTAVDKALRGGKRDLSVGYTVTLDETPGIWNGEKYDAIQRSIRANHLSLVHHGRAGIARLNLDSARKDSGDGTGNSYRAFMSGLSTIGRKDDEDDSGSSYKAFMSSMDSARKDSTGNSYSSFMDGLSTIGRKD
ncbi:MAG: DUF2213 domain-containing protein [Candidatus Accumulibacter phosphatis]|uniref:DUF2213 domain-containing protein n=1 Tax=Candidatus Accumulibacter phosphatis TaxID=327160 RepID=UPI001A3DAC0B|nr:DUF2213 domain-containing protein [Candidatus Accumulibacter phosphatis]